MVNPFLTQQRDIASTPNVEPDGYAPDGNGTLGSRRLSVALVHDYLLVMRGAERTFAAMAASWPEAPIYTLLYDEAGTNCAFSGRDVHTSYLQNLRVHQSGFRRLLPLFPRAAEHLPLRGYDLIISSSSAFAHGVRPSPGAIHVCYCHSPFRYAWFEQERALQEAHPVLRRPMRRFLSRMRNWDRRASERVTGYVANSEATRGRIRTLWSREAALIHPPVDVERFSIGSPEDYLLVVTELVRHKRVEVALEAARRAKRKIKVVGSGPELRRLREEFGANAEFLGRVDDQELEALYAGALALVVPGMEEFGIAAVEAQAAGRPVVAAAAGGVLETVIPGKTGVLVPSGDVDELTRALRETEYDSFDPAAIKALTGFFSIGAFRRRLVSEIERVVARAASGTAGASYQAPAITFGGGPRLVGGAV
jgi:glycosyltransferase involved in cell wall biosynthesis